MITFFPYNKHENEYEYECKQIIDNCLYRRPYNTSGLANKLLLPLKAWCYRTDDKKYM